MHYCSCDLYSYTKLLVPRKVTNHFKHANFTNLGRQNRFAKFKCFYCMKLGQSNNVCYYRKLHLNLLSMNYFESYKSRPIKVWVQKIA